MIFQMKQKFVTFPKFARRVFSIHLNETEANPRSLRKEEDVIGEKREWERERGTMRRGVGRVGKENAENRREMHRMPILVHHQTGDRI